MLSLCHTLRLTFWEWVIYIDTVSSFMNMYVILPASILGISCIGSIKWYCIVIIMMFVQGKLKSLCTQCRVDKQFCVVLINSSIISQWRLVLYLDLSASKQAFIQCHCSYHWIFVCELYICKPAQQNIINDNHLLKPNQTKP